MDDELTQPLETTRQENAAALAETRRHFEKVAAETRRHIEMVAKRLEAKIDAVAEAVVSCNERIDRFEAKFDRFAAEVANGFNDVRAMIRFSHHELDRRLRTLEDVVADLQARVERLESSTH